MKHKKTISFATTLILTLTSMIIKFDNFNIGVSNVHASATLNLDFVKTIGGSGIDSVSSVKKTSDGGYIAVGNSGSSDYDFMELNKGLYDAIICKYDSNGNKIWLKDIGGSNYDYFKSVVESDDGGYIAVGWSESTDGDFAGIGMLGGEEAIIAKFDSNGNKLWLKHLRGDSSDRFYSVAKTPDGGYIAAGSSSSNSYDFSGLNKGMRDLILVKFDSSGNKVWLKDFGGSADDALMNAAVKVNPLDGGFIVAFSAKSNDKDFAGVNVGGNGSEDAIIARFDTNGNKVWIKGIGGTGADGFNALEVSNKNIVAVGYSGSRDGDFYGLNKGVTDAIIVNFDLDGNSLWMKDVGGTWNDYFYDVTKTSDGKYLAVGWSDSTNGDFTGLNKGGRDGIICEFTSSGTINWINNIGGTKDDIINSIDQASDGKYIIAGNSYSSDGNITQPNRGNSDFLIAKLEGFATDTTPPTGTISVSVSNWTNNSITLTCTGLDTESGVNSIQRPDGAWVTGSTATYVVNKNGTYSFNIKDNAGNIGTASINVTNIDTNAPTQPIITVTPDTWTNGNISFTLNGSIDAESGLQKYQYQINNGSWIDYSSAVSITTEGAHNINARAVDNAGNISTTATANAMVDKTIPIISTLNIVPHETSLDISCTASDSLSDLAEKAYRITINGSIIDSSVSDGWKAENTYTVTGLSPNTTYTVKEEVRDSAGNIASIEKTISTLSSAISLYTQATSNSIIATCIGQNTDNTVYRFTLSNGQDSGWTSQNNYTFIGLQANTKYTCKAEAKNQVGDVTAKNIDTYTAAEKPVVLLNKILTNSAEILITNTQSAQYLVSVSNGTSIKYVDNLGNLVDSPVWNTARVVTIKNLVSGTSYKVSAKARNTPGIETDWSDLTFKTTKNNVIWQNDKLPTGIYDY